MISFVIEVSKSCAFYDSGVDKTITGGSGVERAVFWTVELIRLL